MKKLNFNYFLWQAIYEILQIWAKYAILEQMPPYISFFETFASNRHFICNHHQTIKSNKIEETFCEGYWNECVNFSRKMDKNIYKNL